MKRALVFGVFSALVALLVALVSCANPAPGVAPTPAARTGPKADWLSPAALAASKDGKTLYVALETADQVACFDVAAGKVTQTVTVPADPTGVALSADGTQLFVTCADPAGVVAVVDLAGAKVARSFPAGHGACAPVFGADGKTLYVCNRYNNEVAAYDAATGKPLARMATPRQPRAAAFSAATNLLVVANHLPAGPASADVVAAEVSLIDTASNKVVATLALPNGSTSLMGAAVSPDGKYAAVTHILGRYTVPTTQLERGWMNTNALTLVDLAAKKVLNTVLLDDVDAGAANPWGVAFSPDGKLIAVAHAGTHEVSLIDFPAVLEKLAKPAAGRNVEVPDDLSFLVGLRKRIRTPGSGPRAVAFAGGKVYAAEYFTDTLAVIDPAATGPAVITSAAFGPKPVETVQRRGERFFADAALCFQGWQSCTSCHPDARTDALNWDLLNDGIGNPKNSKSMLLAHQTPPAMSLGIRDTAEVAVRSGIRYIQFAVRPEEDAVAIDEYLKSLKPMPSPYLVDGKLSAAATRGQKLFHEDATGCAHCHSGALFTNLKQCDVGTRGAYDKPNDKFDTPTLIEAWRTGPYLHDGSATTLRDVVTTHNRDDRHGKTAHLTKAQIDDLVAYLESL